MLAARVGVYSFCVMIGALWLGAFVLTFFGISVGALRIAGGGAVALQAWGLLTAPEVREARKQEQAESGIGPAQDVAFFPLTLPFTTGPGTIAVCVALSAERPREAGRAVGFLAGVSLAALCIAAIVWLGYRSADRLGVWMGASARRTVARLMAFLLLCIGVQVVINGLHDVFGEFVVRTTQE